MDQSVYMLNVLWFRKEGGKEKYMEYGAAVAPLLEAAGASVNDSYAPEESLIGDWDPDLFFVVRYPSKAAFEAMVGGPEYARIMHLREEALERSLLIRCREYEWV